jgi:hypothetical protein
MHRTESAVEIALESVKRKTFAIVYAWPGWARGGRDEASALGTLVEYGPRYAAVLKSTAYAFTPPEDLEAYKVIERLEGNSTTAFGAPAMPIRGDDKPVSEGEWVRFRVMLQASWEVFDRSLSATKGKELRKGPRGGGRDQVKMLEHVIMADESYLAKLGWKFDKLDDLSPGDQLAHIRHSILDGLQASIRGDIPSKGPRGGSRWTPRFFVRRVIWHILDHAWEIEDRTVK